MLFRDRRDAGEQLSAALRIYQDRRPHILAIPRGGVVVGYEVAVALRAPGPSGRCHSCLAGGEHAPAARRSRRRRMSPQASGFLRGRPVLRKLRTNDRRRSDRPPAAARNRAKKRDWGPGTGDSTAEWG